MCDTKLFAQVPVLSYSAFNFEVFTSGKPDPGWERTTVFSKHDRRVMSGCSCTMLWFEHPFLWPLQLTTGALLTLSVLKVFDKLSYKIHDCKQILQHQTEDLPAFLFLFPGYGFCILKQPAQRALWCIMKSSSLFQTFAHFLTLRVVVFSSTYWLI